MAGLMRDLAASTSRARTQLDKTLDRLTRSDLERPALEQQARTDALAAFRAELDPERFAQLIDGESC
jgi:hypothetical protein